MGIPTRKIFIILIGFFDMKLSIILAVSIGGLLVFLILAGFSDAIEIKTTDYDWIVAALLTLPTIWLNLKKSTSN